MRAFRPCDCLGSAACQCRLEWPHATKLVAKVATDPPAPLPLHGRGGLGLGRAASASPGGIAGPGWRPWRAAARGPGLRPVLAAAAAAAPPALGARAAVHAQGAPRPHRQAAARRHSGRPALIEAGCQWGTRRGRGALSSSAPASTRCHCQGPACSAPLLPLRLLPLRGFPAICGSQPDQQREGVRYASGRFGRGAASCLPVAAARSER